MIGTILVLVVACASHAAPPSPTEPNVPGPMTPFVEPDLVDGPDIADTPRLLAWLDAHRASGAKKLLRVPVVVEFDDAYRLGVQRAWIGNAQTKPEGAVMLDLDDTAMSVAVIDTLRSLCPPGPTCAIVVDGLWGAVVPMPPLPGDDPSRKAFGVRRVVGAQENAVTRVRIER